MTLLYLTLAGAIAAAIALPFAIRSLIRRARLEALARLPVTREHQVNLPAGDVILHLSGPLGKIGLGHLSFALLDAGGISVPSAVVFAAVVLIVFTVLTLLLWLSPEARQALTSVMSQYAA